MESRKSDGQEKRISPQLQKALEVRRQALESSRATSSSHANLSRQREGLVLSAGASDLLAERMRVNNIQSLAYSKPMMAVGYRPGWQNIASPSESLQRAASAADFHSRYKSYLAQKEAKKEEDEQREYQQLQAWRRAVSDNDPDYMKHLEKGRGMDRVQSMDVIGNRYTNRWLSSSANQAALNERQKEYIDYLKAKSPVKLESYIRGLTDNGLKGKAHHPGTFGSLSADYQFDIENERKKEADNRKGMAAKTEAVKNDLMYMQRVRENEGSRSGSLLYNQLIGTLLPTEYANEYDDSYAVEKLLTKDELNTLRYIIGGDGSRRKEAEEYAAYLGDVMKRRASENIVEGAKKASDDSLAAALLLNAGLSYPQAAEYITGAGMRTPLNLLTGQRKPIDYDRDFAYTRAKEAARASIKDRFIDHPVMQFLVDTGLSMTEAGARLPLGSAGLGVAGISAAASDHYSKRNSGANELDIAASAALSGLWEGVTEKFSLESLGGTVANPPKTMKAFIKSVLKQGGVEASEEAFNEMLSSISDGVLLKEFSDYGQNVAAYKEQGFNEQDSHYNAVIDKLHDIATASAGGFVSGGLFGVGGSSAGTLNTSVLTY